MTRLQDWQWRNQLVTVGKDREIFSSYLPDINLQTPPNIMGTGTLSPNVTRPIAKLTANFQLTLSWRERGSIPPFCYTFSCLDLNRTFSLPFTLFVFHRFSLNVTPRCIFHVVSKFNRFSFRSVLLHCNRTYCVSQSVLRTLTSSVCV